MSVTVTMDGFDKVAAQLDHFPKEVEKAIKKTMRKSAKPYLAAVKGSMPFPEWNSELTIKTKVSSRQGRIMLSSGVFGTTHLDNGAIPAFFKFLWRNYGTLTLRSPEHEFKTPVRANRNRKNNVGQPAHMDFERVTQGAETAIAEAVVATIDDEVEKLEKEVN